MASPQGGRCRRHLHSSNIKILHLPPAIVGGFSYICEKDDIMTYDLARWDGKTSRKEQRKLPESSSPGTRSSSGQPTATPGRTRGWRTSTKEGGARPSRMAAGWKNERPRMNNPGFLLLFDKIIWFFKNKCYLCANKMREQPNLYTP